MHSSLKKWWEIVLDTFKKFFEEKTFQYSAAIAYFTIFSLPGIAIISVMVASSFFYEDEQVRNELLKQISLLAGQSSADQVESLMSRTFLSSESWIMKIVGSVVIIISTTTVFITLQDSLNAIWKIKPKPKKMILKFVLNRLLSLAMVASIGFMILVSLTLDTFIALLRHIISGHLAGMSFYVIYAINIALNIGVIVLVFASIYKVLPDVKIRWKDVWLGAIVTTILFVAGKYLIAYYLGNADFNDAYGATGSLVALLAWVYYSVLILFFGANFTYVYLQHSGKHIAPSKGAVGIKMIEIEKEDRLVNQQTTDESKD